MITEGYKYKFAKGVRLLDTVDTLLLSLLAAEGIYGQARIPRNSLRFPEEGHAIP